LRVDAWPPLFLIPRDRCRASMASPGLNWGSSSARPRATPSYSAARLAHERNHPSSLSDEQRWPDDEDRRRAHGHRGFRFPQSPTAGTGPCGPCSGPISFARMSRGERAKRSRRIGAYLGSRPVRASPPRRAGRSMTDPATPEPITTASTMLLWHQGPPSRLTASAAVRLSCERRRCKGCKYAVHPLTSLSDLHLVPHNSLSQSRADESCGAASCKSHVEGFATAWRISLGAT